MNSCLKTQSPPGIDFEMCSFHELLPGEVKTETPSPQSLRVEDQAAQIPIYGMRSASAPPGHRLIGRSPHPVSQRNPTQHDARFEKWG
jgi:hypothetical protein